MTENPLKRLKKLGIEYRFVSALMGFTQPYISDLANGKKPIREANVRKVEWIFSAVEDLTRRFKAQFGEAS